MRSWPLPGVLTGVIGGPPMPSLTGTASDRRTLYGFIDRLNLPGVYRTFDFPDPTTTSPRRDQTTVAPQALFLMNHPFVIDAARAVCPAPRSPPNPGRHQGRRLYRLIYGRSPSDEDIALAREFLAGDRRRRRSLAIFRSGAPDGQ